MEHTMQIIARIRSDFSQKFGIPRQSGLVPSLEATVVFEPEYRNADALRGLEGFSHLWLLWEFSESVGHPWTPTVRPPRLGGNARMGVFATRSPFRPNPIGLSCVRLKAIRTEHALGTVLDITGADLLNGTPIFDIKPYIPYADAHPDAVGGFAQAAPPPLHVECAPTLLQALPEARRAALLGVLAQDPRPSYQDDPARLYAMQFAGFDVRFRVSEGTLTVVQLEPLSSKTVHNA